MTLLSVSGLSVRYGRVKALQTVSLEVNAGDSLTILGRNGAGKSSLLGAIIGTVRPAAGKVQWKGRDITSLSPDRRVRLGLGLVPEGRRVFGELSVRENLRLGGFSLPRAAYAQRLQEVFDLFPILSKRADLPAARLSGGEQQMLAIGRALMASPEVLLLDEPSLGLAPLVVDEVYAQLQGLRERGITLVVVEQHVQRALRFADHAMVLHLGEVALREDPAVLAKDPRLVAAYLGAVNRS